MPIARGCINSLQENSCSCPAASAAEIARGIEEGGCVFWLRHAFVRIKDGPLSELPSSWALALILKMALDGVLVTIEPVRMESILPKAIWMVIWI